MMSLFKPKAKPEDLLPPPPAPDLDLEARRPKPVLFDAVLDFKLGNDSAPEIKEFQSLIKDIEGGQKAKPGKKMFSNKKQYKKSKKAKLQNNDAPKHPASRGLGNSFNDGPFEQEDHVLNVKQQSAAISRWNSQELLDSREEIIAAIDKIKAGEKPSLLRRLFGLSRRNEPVKPYQKENIIFGLPEIDKAAAIRNGISMARNSLMSLDLDAAKKHYLEVIKAYKSIAKKDRAKFYDEVKDLYFERKSAERLAR